MTQVNAVVTEKMTTANIQIAHISADKNQPRKQFGEEAMQELVASIKKNGIVSPLIVYPSGLDESTKPRTQLYTLIAGERRLRAAKLAGLVEVPCIIRRTDDSETRATVQLIENAQREDLSPIEQAEGFKKWLKINGGQGEETTRRLADAIGWKVSKIEAFLRLLWLPEEAQEMVAAGDITPDKAKELARIGLDKPELITAAMKVVVDSKKTRVMSERDVEHAVDKIVEQPTKEGRHNAIKDLAAKVATGNNKGLTHGEEAAATVKPFPAPKGYTLPEFNAKEEWKGKNKPIGYCMESIIEFYNEAAKESGTEEDAIAAHTIGKLYQMLLASKKAMLTGTRHANGDK